MLTSAEKIGYVLPNRLCATNMTLAFVTHQHIGAAKHLTPMYGYSISAASIKKICEIWLLVLSVSFSQFGATDEGSTNILY